MAIWNEIKKSINSNLNKPLDKLIGSSNDNTTVIDKLDSVLNKGRYIDSHVGNYMNEFGLLPYSMGDGCAVVYKGELHILGGNSLSDTLLNTRLQHYKWDGKNWVGVSTLPHQFESGCALVYAGSLCLLGGVFGGPNMSDFYKYNDDGSWTSIGTLPFPFDYGLAIVYNNELHILGSKVGSDFFNYHYKWDGGSWTSVSTLPYSSDGSSAVVYNNEIHLLSSCADGCRTIHYKWDGTSWTSVSTIPIDSWGRQRAIVYNNEIHLVGCNSINASVTPPTIHYKWDGGNWTSVSTLPRRHTYGCTIIYDDDIYIIGDLVETLNGVKNRDNFYKFVLNTAWVKAGYQASRIPIKEPSTIYACESDALCINENTREVINGIYQNNLTVFNITTSGVYRIYTKSPYLIK